jgi:hypothetical protein
VAINGVGDGINSRSRWNRYFGRGVFYCASSYRLVYSIPIILLYIQCWTRYDYNIPITRFIDYHTSYPRPSLDLYIPFIHQSIIENVHQITVCPMSLSSLSSPTLRGRLIITSDSTFSSLPSSVTTPLPPRYARRSCRSANIQKPPPTLPRPSSSPRRS